MIYFIGNIAKDICKIGYSQRPHRRIKSIQSTVDYPLIILDIIEGTMQDEKVIHASHDHCRITGEWYVLSQIKSLDINKHVTVFDIGGISLIRNKKGYYHATSLINSINKIRIKRNRNRFNYSVWVIMNKEFLDSFKTINIDPITKGYAYWLHPYVTIEIMRNDPVIKLIAYENLHFIIGKQPQKIN